MRTYYEAGTQRPLIRVPIKSVIIDGDMAFVPPSAIRRISELEELMMQGSQMMTADKATDLLDRMNRAIGQLLERGVSASSIVDDLAKAATAVALEWTEEEINDRFGDPER